MRTVKGSKHYDMVVVQRRPWYVIGGLVLLVIALVASLIWSSYQLGMDEGLSTRVWIVQERDDLAQKLKQSVSLTETYRQEVAALKLADEIDLQADVGVQQTILELQTQLARVQEEVQFYKGVMLPKVEDKGLRIERLRVENSGEPNRFKYNLLLTQVVNKYDYVQGDVEINLVGDEDNLGSNLPFGDISTQDQDSIRFRFRYFQNIDGELMLPDGFTPKEVMVVAQSTGRSSQRQERRFTWQVGEG
ncbi:MAG: hypothetical protein CMP98_03640 [Gammaproteobacteria bacterium]|nr:hypothetical protein [Gammaproteobacteria bacterium]OUU10956.1 MAG: hypothetical protein CBB94_03755 [Gammaproteobacteria bacterium TMED34]|tara:strand:+ start:112 stop:852 length:741 start_codon:yes stop_codon:yes gene_type:complete